MTALRIALVAALAAGAVIAALLAGDVHAWQSALTGGDAVYVATPSRAVWTPRTRVGAAAQGLLGVADDVRLRDALQLYDDSAKQHLRLDNAVEVESARAHAQDALERVARAPDRPSASQAQTLLGILAFRAAASGTSQSQIDAALSDFSDAVRADPQNVEAAYDLELLLRLSVAHGSRIEPGQGGGFGRTGHRGAGAGQPGAGY